MNSIVERIQLIIGLIVTFFTIALTFYLITSMTPFFTSLVVPLPLITKLVLEFYWITFVLPVLVLFTWYLWPNPLRRGLAAFFTGLGGSFLFSLIMAGALSWPIL